MDFIKFRSIGNSYMEKFINQIHLQEKDKGEWCVIEKVHGANFSILTDGFDVRAAKRNGFLKGNINGYENFYNGNELLEKYELNATALYEEIKELFDNLEVWEQYGTFVSQIIIYGEIFGGSYDHPEVSREILASKVQKGVDYAPYNEFYVFDIYVITEQLNKEEKSGFFLDYPDVLTLGQKNDFICAYPLFIGKFEECLSYKNEFQTTIPDLLGLPPILDNICEGVVIKPYIDTDRYLLDGSRVILKNKNDKFSEKSSEKRKLHKENIFNDEEMKLFEEAVRYITEIRFYNALSHHTNVFNVTMKDYGSILGYFAKDVLTEFMTEHEDKYNTLEKPKQISFNKLLNKYCSTFMKPFMNKLSKFKSTEN